MGFWRAANLHFENVLLFKNLVFYCLLSKFYLLILISSRTFLFSELALFSWYAFVYEKLFFKRTQLISSCCKIFKSKNHTGIFNVRKPFQKRLQSDWAESGLQPDLPNWRSRVRHSQKLTPIAYSRQQLPKRSTGRRPARFRLPPGDSSTVQSDRKTRETTADELEQFDNAATNR